MHRLRSRLAALPSLLLLRGPSRRRRRRLALRRRPRRHLGHSLAPQFKPGQRGEQDLRERAAQGAAGGRVQTEVGQQGPSEGEDLGSRAPGDASVVREGGAEVGGARGCVDVEKRGLLEGQEGLGEGGEVPEEGGSDVGDGAGGDGAAPGGN